MQQLVYIAPLDRQVAIQHLTLWFGAESPALSSGPQTLFLGRTAELPLGVRQGLSQFQANFFSQREDFCLVVGFLDWPPVRKFLSRQDPEFLLSLEQAALRPKPRFQLPHHNERIGPQVMGILNLTPDSFFDGGLYQAKELALAQAEKLIKEGADWLDLGGESTRPGSDPVSIEQETSRVLPVLQAIKQRWSIPLSVDTTKPEVAKLALEAGASMVNDVSGLDQPEEMLHWVNHFEAGYVLMHTQGTPKTMQLAPSYSHPVLDVFEFFEKKLLICKQQGLDSTRILLDPGIGFGKLLVHNLELLRLNAAWASLGCQTLLGTSNKSFLSKALDLPVSQRGAASLSTQVLGYHSGADFFRVHQVKETRQALDMVCAYQNIPEA